MAADEEAEPAEGPPEKGDEDGRSRAQTEVFDQPRRGEGQSDGREGGDEEGDDHHHPEPTRPFPGGQLPPVPVLVVLDEDVALRHVADQEWEEEEAEGDHEMWDPPALTASVGEGECHQGQATAK